MTTWRPTQDYLLLAPEIPPEHSAGGIYIPQQARESLKEGRVLVKGPLCSDRINVGDDVVFSQSSEFKFEIDLAGPAKEDGRQPTEIIVVVQEMNIILCKPAKSDQQFIPSRVLSGRCAFHDQPLPCLNCEAESHKPRPLPFIASGRCAQHDNLLPCPVCLAESPASSRYPSGVSVELSKQAAAHTVPEVGGREIK